MMHSNFSSHLQPITTLHHQRNMSFYVGSYLHALVQHKLYNTMQANIYNKCSMLSAMASFIHTNASLRVPLLPFVAFHCLLLHVLPLTSSKYDAIVVPPPVLRLPLPPAKQAPRNCVIHNKMSKNKHKSNILCHIL